MNICVSKIGHHCLRQWFVVRSVPRHYLYKCQFTVNRIIWEQVSVKIHKNIVDSSPLVPHVYGSANWVSISIGNGLPPVRHQVITWTNADWLSIGIPGTNFSEIWIGILSFLFRKLHLKLSSAKMAAILSMGWWVKIASESRRPFFLSFTLS